MLARPIRLVLLALAVISLALPVRAVDTTDTRMLSEPALSAERIAFVYAGDLWVARRDGSDVHRLSAHAGVVGAPHFSPDGEWIAFSAQYDGNVDVYLVPADGGAPQRLTWHPGADQVQGFTADGSAVVFISPRSVHTWRHRHLYTVPVVGGFPQRIPLPNVHQAAVSPDGAKIAYVPDRPAFLLWKHYRGGTASRIWIYDVADHSVQQVPQPPGRCNDADPAWIDGRVWFRSDRDGEFNLYSYDPATETVERHTHHDDEPVLSLSTGDGRVIYEQAGYLHLYDPAADASERLVLGVAADLVERRPRYESAGDFVRNTGISPTGVRAVFETRGEIVTVPAEEGDARNLTRTAGVRELSPAWSPDGRWIAYLSDASGEYALVIAPHDGRATTGETRSIPLHGSGFYEDLKWSPDGQWISYTDNSRSLYVLDVASGASRKVSQETMYGPINTLHHAWSPDSRWLVYTHNTKTYFQTLELYAVEDGSSHRVTEGLSDVGEPVFDAGGDYLWFSASTDAGPIRQWFSLSNTDADATNALYVAVLRQGAPSPLAPRNPEEATGDADSKKDGNAKASGEGEEGEPPAVTIDFDGLDQRIVALPLEPALYSHLQPGPAGSLYYVKNRAQAALAGPEGQPALARFQMKSREEETLADGVDDFALSADHKKVLYHAGESWAIADADGKMGKIGKIEGAGGQGKGTLALDAIRLHVDPPAEWRQIYDEAWRIERDYFYDPGMHGADWPAVHDKYATYLPDLATRADLNRVLGWMGSELTVGHLFVGGGDTRNEPMEVPGGLLGADYTVDQGRYRFTKIYGGLNWNPTLRAPLTEPGVDVRAGEYLLAVDGRELTADENLYSRFEATAGQIVEITVGDDPAAAPGDPGTRTVEVVPVENEAALRNRAWVEGNLRKVDEATDGRVAYVYVPNTAALGHTYFKRYFYPQADRDAIIVDERYNGGGLVADYYIDALRRPLISHWAMRYGDDLKTPLASIQGPKVMIIDQNAGSGGDLLPWMFHKLNLGTLVGKRTWGGLVGILGFPRLLDGGGITAPNLAIWTEDGWVVENEGVPPDVEVEQLPAEVMAGHDPQLEKAIEVALEQLEANPPERAERPPYPKRAAPGNVDGQP